MKRFLLLFTISVVLFAADAIAQPNIFNPNDPIVSYNPASPPTMPPANTMAKWVRTSRMSWSTTRFKSYIWNGMAYRLRYPNNYNPADLTKKYPVIVFFHGAGEIAEQTDNEYQLLWGAQLFESKINAGLFDAFLLFPQVAPNNNWNYTYSTRINSVLDSLEKYCKADPDKVISMGLSNGGYGALAYATDFPQRTAVVISSSPALIQIIGRQQNITHIPLWLGSGGRDTNPDTASMRNYVESFKALGGDVRWSYYPTGDHNIWSDQWNEPYLIPYWTTAHKANPLIFSQRNLFCPDSAIDARLGITGGFAQYQWQKDGVDIAGQVSNEMIATALGTYRVRFKRTTASAWSEWSLVPAVISAKPATVTPNIQITGMKSKVLPASDGSTTVPLELPAGYGSYEWRRTTDNVLVSTQRAYAAPVGSYKGLISGCNRTFSPTFTVISAAGTPKPDAASNLTITRLTTTSIRLNWTEVASPVSNETGFEIYRGATAGGPYTMIFLTAADIKTYTETNLPDNFNGYYRIRAVNNTGASALSNEATLQPASDIVAPSVPANLKVIYTGHTFIDLDWDNSTDNVGVTGYDVYVDNVKKYTTTVSNIRADSLATNKTFVFKIIARDQVGNSSASSTTVTATSVANGLKYRYYEGVWSVLPDFSTLTPVKTGSTPNIDLTVRTPNVNDGYGFVWEGYISIVTPGTYTFETNSDDGSKLYFNSFYSPSATPLISNDGVHAAISVTGTVNIPAAGLYPIAITFFDYNLSESMQVYWTGPGITRQLIPNSAFTEANQAPPDVIAPSVPANLKIVYTGRTFTDLDWDISNDNTAVTGYDVFVDGVLKYSPAVSNVTVDNLTPNTLHSFAVKAHDLAGNASGLSSAVSSTNTANGLKYRYYEGNWDLLPNFSNLTPFKTGSTPNIDLTLRTPGINDYFGFVWEGYINIKTAGTYTFETNSDNGSKLYFNSFYAQSAIPLVNNDGSHPATSVSSTINIATPGLYPIAMTFFEKDGGESMDVYWSGPGFTRQLIPDVAFTDPASDNVAPTVPLNVKALYAGKTYVNLDWDNSTDNLAVTGYDVYVNGVKKYTTAESAITADGLIANTSYSFTVKAVDLTANASAASAALTASTTTTTTGLKYRYYEGNWDLLPNFNALTPAKSGSTGNVDIVTPRTAGVTNYFGFVWEGYINIKTAGTYTFETNSDNGSKLYFNSFYSPLATPLVNNDGPHPATSVSATVNVATPGLYPIAITFFEKDGGENMDVYWTGPGFTRQAIPDVAFTDPASDALAPTVPLNVRALYTGKTYVNLDWDNSTDNLAVTGYDVYVNGTKKYTTAESAITADGLIANTSYSFTVKAVDLSSNASAASAAITASTTTTTTGLKYRYYEGDWDLLPNFNALTPVKSGSTGNVDIVTPRTAGVTNYFGFVWEGYINIKTAGTYTFETNSDNGSKLYFNSFYSPLATPLVNNDGAHPATSVSATVNIATPGLYPIAITFFEKDGGENMDVYWTGPGFTRQAIPDVAFTDPASDALAPTVPLNVRALYTGKTYVNLDWDNSTDNLAVTGYDVYVNGTKKYTTAESAITADGLIANTSYSFTVKAVDLSSNASAASAAVTAATTNTISGLKYRYYEGDWDLLPNFNALTPVKSGSTGNVDIVTPRTAGVTNFFGFVWEGYINIKTAGTYTFETNSDNGSKLYFNSFYSPLATPLVNNDGAHPATSVSATVNIATPGLYPIAMTFFEKDGGESMDIYWTGPGFTRQAIPDVAFTDPASDITAPTVPLNVKALYTGKTYVNLDWDNSTDNLAVTGYDVYVNGVKKYTTVESAITADGLTASTSYTFTVKAVDLASNNSAASTAVIAATTATPSGLNYRYYEGTWDVLPNFNTLTPVKTGSTPNVDIMTPRTPGVINYFGFVWEGYINIQTAGTYTFETVSDDGSKLYFNKFYSPSATALITNDNTHPATSVSATVNIATPGLYPIAMTFFEKDGGESMEVYWSGPGFTRQLIPNAAFTGTAALQAPTESSASNDNLLRINSTEKAINANSMVATRAYPNPFVDKINVEFLNTKAGSSANVGVYNLGGKLIYSQNFGNLPAGNTTLPVKLNYNEMMPGVYLMRLNINGVPFKMWKMVKERR